MNEIELKDLCGERLLSGVDRATTQIDGWRGDVDCQVLNFTLDGKTYSACEDPSDGYRSSMRYLHVSDTPTKNTFAPVKVIGRMRADDARQKNEVLELVDAVTGKIVIAVGTANTDDYYPWWVAEFSPENMACNAHVPDPLEYRAFAPNSITEWP